MGPVIGFLAGGVVLGSLVWWRARGHYRRLLRAEAGKIERAFDRSRGQHLRRVRTLAPVAAGAEIARHYPLSSSAALGAAVVTGAVLLAPVGGDGRELDAELAPVHPSGPVVVEPARQDAATAAGPEPGDAPADEPEPEPEAVTAATPADEPDAEPATEATPTTAPPTVTTTTAAATITVTASPAVPELPELTEIPTPLADPEPKPGPEPEPEGCVIGLSAELAGTRVGVCV